MSKIYALAASILINLFLTATITQAAVSLKLQVSLKPEHLGQGTTVGFNLHIIPRTSPIPPPLTEVNVSYPGDLGIGLSEIGLATCPVTTLETDGPTGCPAEAQMGYGSVLAEILLAGEIIQEHATLEVLRAATQEGNISLYFYAHGSTPISDEIVFPGALLPAEPPFGERLHIDVPLVPSVPEAPYISVAQIHGTLGPQHLTYYHHIRHKLVAYNPQGILLPKHCPQGGFWFKAQLKFLDNTQAETSASVPCPHS